MSVSLSSYKILYSCVIRSYGRETEIGTKIPQRCDVFFNFPRPSLPPSHGYALQISIFFEDFLPSIILWPCN
jgi:hypothetical protein